MSLKEEILLLRSRGSSYDVIEEVLSCSKGTISYHCSSVQREKTAIRRRKRRKTNILENKIAGFFNDGRLIKGRLSKVKNPYHALNVKIDGFHSVKVNRKRRYVRRTFTLKEFKNKIGEAPKCFWTGRDIDLNDSPGYSIDHYIPKSRGGKSELSNAEITCSQANYAKGDLMPDEFIQLCKEVLEHNGYTIKKI